MPRTPVHDYRDVGGTTAWRQEVERRLERAPRATQAMARKAGGRTTQEQLSEQLPRKRSGGGGTGHPESHFKTRLSGL